MSRRSIRDPLSELGLDSEKELVAEQKSKVIQKLVNYLSENDKEFYYLSTAEIAFELTNLIKDNPNNLINKAEKELVSSLSSEDLQVIISFHSKS